MRGELTIQPRTDVPERRFVVGNVLGCDHPTLHTLTIAAARPHSGRLLVTFDEVADRTTAESLRGCLLFITADELGPAGDEGDDADSDGGWWDHELIGLRARTLDGVELGTVSDVVHGPGGELLSVSAAGGREILVPFVHEIVPTVDPAAGVVVIDPPPGLLEL